MATPQKQYALYLELHKDVRGGQIIIIPPLYNPVTQTTSSAKALTRKISPAHPRRSWNTVTMRGEYNAAPLEGGVSTRSTIAVVAPIINSIGNLLTGYASGRWVLQRQPIVVELSFDDIRDLEDNNTPAALYRRIMKARAEAGFPSSVWPTPESSFATPASSKILTGF